MHVTKRQKFLFIYTAFSTFVETDFEILSKKYSVQRYQYQLSNTFFASVINQIKLISWTIKNIGKAYGVYIWFADYYSLFPILIARLTNRKSYLVLGGYDVTVIPDLNYGSLTNPVRAFCVKHAMKNATLNLAVSDFIEADARLIAPEARIKTVYTGFDKDKFYPSANSRERMAITVCSGDTWQRLRVKGIDVFVEVASELPDITFIVFGVGPAAIDHFDTLPDNVTFIERQDHAGLLKHYQSASIYCQFSIREGLPSAVCEAMLCECIPVGFDNGGIGIAIGEAGYLIEHSNKRKAVEIIKSAMDNKSNLGSVARKRIIEHFSLEKREKIFDSLL